MGAARTLTLLAFTLLASTATAAQTISAVNNFQIVSRLTGPGAINNTSAVGIGGTDLGHSVNHNGKTYFLFGDTFSGDTPAAGGNWRHNVMAWSTDANPADGIVFDDWLRGTNGLAKEVIRSNVGSPVTEIPTGAVSVNNRIYTWFMAVDAWGPNGGEWTNERAGLARWQEGESAFTPITGFNFAGNSNFGQVAASLRSPLENASDDNVYLWGTPAGRFGGVKLARVAPAQIENRSAYQFFDGVVGGSPTWTSNEFVADFLVNAPTGEMSVMYNPAVAAWTMMSFDEVSDTFQIRQSPTPWGNWSSPLTVATSSQAPGGLYAPYMNPLYTADGGRTLYFSMSVWNTYDVYLAKATLAVTLPGDADRNGVIDADDYFWINRGYSRELSGWSNGDFNLNGIINGDDYAIIDAAYSASMPAAAVPEPAGAWVLCAALLLWTNRRRESKPVIPEYVRWPRIASSSSVDPA